MKLFNKKKTKKNDAELQNAAPLAKSEDVFIKSTEEQNKTDGVITIATINNDTITPANVQMPAMIDVEERHNRVVESKKQKQKKKIKNSASSKKANTITSIIALITIGFIGVFFYYVKTKDQEEVLKLKTVTIELGSEISKNPATYIDKENIDEMAYSIDYSAIDPNTVGEYKFKVTYQNIVKEGTAIVQDTTSPTVEVQEQLVSVGETITPEQFIKSCSDLSNCNYEFENKQIVNSTEQTGEYDIYIVVRDDYNNSVRKKTILKVVDNISTLKCTLKDNDSEINDYIYTQNFELSFYENNYFKHRAYNTFKFSDQDKYNENKEKFTNRENYQFDDENLTILYILEFTYDENYSLEDYQKEYINKGFTCVIE